jgi:3-oxoacyl-[acyl-carrier-protein] synthase I
MKLKSDTDGEPQSRVAGQPVAWIESCTISSAAGMGLDSIRRWMVSGKSPLRPNDWPALKSTAWVGRVPDGFDAQWRDEFAPWESRNNRLAWAGLQQDGILKDLHAMIGRFGAQRIGLLVGTSTSSIARTEEAYAALGADGHFATRYVQHGIHDPHSTGAFLAAALGIAGPAMTVSTACSSGAKILATAARWLEAGLVDAVLAAGVDSLCLSTVHGFKSLQLVAQGPCRPFDQHRDGLNIGEAAAFVLLTREPFGKPRASLVGHGETCDAYHLSSPHPQGRGAIEAMRIAMGRAAVLPRDIGYVNLHGTGTRSNDHVEALAMAAVFPEAVPASSTKGLTGHTLGAAGLVEAIIAVDTMLTGLLPATANLEQPGSDIAYPLLMRPLQTRPRHVMSNSFGFGGSNCSLVFAGWA